MLKKYALYQACRDIRIAIKRKISRWQQLRSLKRYASELKLISGDPESLNNDAPLLFFTVYNQLPLIPSLLDYYRSIGCRNFIFIDNGSTDGTREWLISQPHVVIWLADKPRSYANSKSGVQWINHLLYQYPRERWVMKVDADEFLVLPHDCASIDDLILQAERAGDISIMTPMLDMYANKKPEDIQFDNELELRNTCCYFDGPEHYTLTKKPHYIDIHGGPSDRLFSNPSNRPLMTKVVCFKWAYGAYLRSSHAWQCAQPRSLSAEKSHNLPNTITLLRHYKFLSNTSAEAKNAVARGEAWNNAEKYKLMLERMDEQWHTRLHDAFSLKWSDAADGEDFIKAIQYMYTQPPSSRLRMDEILKKIDESAADQSHDGI